MSFLLGLMGARVVPDPSMSVPGLILAIDPWRGRALDVSGNFIALADGSGSGNNLAQAISADRPAYVASDSSLNRQPSISFAGSQWMSSSTVSYAQPITQVVVAYCSNFTASTMMLSSTGASRVDMYIAAGGKLSSYAGTGFLYNTPIDHNAHVFACVQNGASSALYIDNSQTPVATGNAGANAWQNFELGGLGGAGNQFSGGMGAVRAYSSSVSAANLKQIFRFFGGRFGIATA